MKDTEYVIVNEESREVVPGSSWNSREKAIRAAGLKQINTGTPHRVREVSKARLKL